MESFIICDRSQVPEDNQSTKWNCIQPVVSKPKTSIHMSACSIKRNTSSARRVKVPDTIHEKKSTARSTAPKSKVVVSSRKHAIGIF